MGDAAAARRVARVQPLTTARAVRGPFDYDLPAGDERWAEVGVGSVLVVPFGPQRLRGVVVELAESSEHRLRAPLEVEEARLAPELVALALWTAEDVVSTPARCLELLLPPRGTGALRRLWAEAARVPQEGERLTAGQAAALGRLPGWAGDDLAVLRRLERRGLVTVGPRDRVRTPAALRGADGAPAGAGPGLNADQAAAVAAIDGAAAGERLLLHGVTGSGKTEVYLHAAEHALHRDGGVLVLVPEIGLTPQTVARFRARLGDTVAVLHSRLSAGERRDEWWRLRRGQARVVVGPMSAVWAPVRDVRLVIVDEEHDPAFRHDGDPRYDARRVAAKRAGDAGAVLVVGTATPRVETGSALRRIRLPGRADGRPLPPVELVDMRGVRSALHPRTHHALVDARKAIVLLNRRGWSNFLDCGACGHVWGCPNCDVTLVLHQRQGALRCHHCGHREPVPSACVQCGSLSIGRHGMGTEQLASELPGRAFRLDADVRDPMAVLQAFREAEDGILVGTQMVAKGHDFPDVELAVVVDADGTLRFPDLRAQERTFALVTQLAGRAGRAGEGHGRVLVQTLAPHEPALVRAAEHDADGFLAEELERRRALGWPPFAVPVRVVCEHEDGDRAAAAARAVRDRLPGAMGPAPLFRRQGRERWQVLDRDASRRAVVGRVREAVHAASGAAEHRGVVWVVEVDP